MATPHRIISTRRREGAPALPACGEREREVHTSAALRDTDLPYQIPMRAAEVSPIQVWVEITGPGNYEHVGKAQSVRIMIDPVIFTHTRTQPEG
eukprot:COSAG01_NODE_7511_length_3175_cov_31.744473_1_plen_93_part_10